MEMHQARYFLAVCETLNFTRAAQKCAVAQPSLTRAIIKLEEEMGGQLFRREGRRTHLTDLGEIVRPHMERIRSASESAQAEAREFENLERAPLNLGVMCTIGPARLVDFFARARTEIPALQLNLRETKGTVLVEELVAGALDVALIGLPQLPDRLDAHPLFSERYVVAHPRGHRFEAMQSVPVNALAGEDFLDRPNCEFPDHARAKGDLALPDFNLVYSSDREDWIQAMVLAGLGSAIMPEFLPTAPGIATRPLANPEMERTVSIVTVAGRRFSPPVRALMQLAKSYDWDASV